MVMAVDAALDPCLELVTSPKLLAEVADVLGRPRLRRYLSTDEATRYVDDLAALTVQLNDPGEPHAAVCRNPRDDYLVALARSSGAEAIVTGGRPRSARDRPQRARDRDPHAAASRRASRGQLIRFGA